MKKGTDDYFDLAISIALYVIILIGTVSFLFSMSGCAVMPDSIPVEAQHLSHITQHFGPHKTEMGFNAVFIGAKWNNGPVVLEMKDGYSFNLYDHRHEMFEASVKYEFKVRK